MTRGELFAALGQGFDLLVIGGGATGVGVAWDAATRGLRVALLEARDFGAGTSSRSTKLIHGGVRYLAQGRLGLVREALAERALLQRHAPAFVTPLRFVVPVLGFAEKWKFRAGLAAYDLLAGRDAFPPSSWLSPAALAQAVPGLRRTRFDGGVSYFDGQFDDAALLYAVLRAAVGAGATCLNYAAVTRLLKTADGRLRGVGCVDVETGQAYEVAARCVVNATGPGAGAVLALDDPRAATPLQLSRGSHLVVGARFLGGDSAVLMPRVGDGRVMFAIPWLGHTLLGTTDIAAAETDPEPAPFEREIDAILAAVARYLDPAPTRADVTAMFCGLRPLAGGSTTATARVSREHALAASASGLVTITGGKWTTFRRMALDTVDFALARSGLSAGRSRTALLALDALPGSSGPSLAGFPLGEDACRAAARTGYARRTEDVLARRCRALFTDVRAALAAAPQVARMLGEELGRSEAEIARDLAAFNALAARYSCRASPGSPPLNDGAPPGAE